MWQFWTTIRSAAHPSEGNQSALAEGNMGQNQNVEAREVMRQTARRCRRRQSTSAVCLAVLALTATPDSGHAASGNSAKRPRTSLRGARQDHSEPLSATPSARQKRTQNLRGSRAASAVNKAEASGLAAVRQTPSCSSVFVPSVAGNLTGTYTFEGRYNDNRPVFVNEEKTNNFFAQTPEEGTDGSTGGATNTTWYMTQMGASLPFFLSLESDAFEPADIAGLQPWIRNNDPDCSGGSAACTAMMLLSCSAWADEADPTGAPTSVAEEEALPSAILSNTSAPVIANGTVATTPAPSVPEDLQTMSDDTSTAYSADSSGSQVMGCVNLDISANGRTGIYLLLSPEYSNGKPGYVFPGYRTDAVYSLGMDVCAQGWGVVNSTWAQASPALSPNSTVREVWLEYAAGLHLDTDGACGVDVWIIANGEPQSLAEAGVNTFIAVSSVDDPSEVTQWAKYTPATDSARARIVDNDWISVDCMDAEDVEEAEDSEETGT